MALPPSALFVHCRRTLRSPARATGVLGVSGVDACVPSPGVVPPPSVGGGVTVVASASANRSRLLVDRVSSTTFGVALDVMIVATCAGEKVGFADKMRAATPATCGDAIDVPEMVPVAVVPVCHADLIPDPGANMSTHSPKLENDERVSLVVVEPTVIALGAAAGENPHASAVLFPAATTTLIPSSTARCTAASKIPLSPPPKLMFRTAGLEV